MMKVMVIINKAPNYPDRSVFVLESISQAGNESQHFLLQYDSLLDGALLQFTWA